MVKRAICLAGGGPAVGLSLGALKRLDEADIRFDVWSCACIGAWAGVVWNQAPKGQEWETTESFFKGIFRPDDIYSRFPIASAFAPDLNSMTMNTIEFMLDPKNYQNLIVPDAIARAVDSVLRFMSDPRQWSIGNFNSMLLNDVLAVNPFSRFLTSLMYLSPTKGLARIWYKHSDFLNQIDFKALRGLDKPYLYINAYNLTKERVDQFSNRDDTVGEITSKSLCACSALPYIEEPVEIDGDLYCEGATIDTVNFQGLLHFHGDLDEIWVSRLVDSKQARPPQNLYDALNNLVMLFAASVSVDDVRMFEEHLRKIGSKAKVIEIPVSHDITYDWTWSNLQAGVDYGYKAAGLVIDQYKKGAYDQHDKAVNIAAQKIADLAEDNAKRIAESEKLAQAQEAPAAPAQDVFEAVAEVAAVEAVVETAVVEAVVETVAVEAVVETVAVEAVAETAAVEAVVETVAVEAVAETAAVEAVAETAAVETVAETAAVEAVAETVVVETVVETAVVEAVVETAAVEAAVEAVAETVAAPPATATVTPITAAAKNPRRRSRR